MTTKKQFLIDQLKRCVNILVDFSPSKNGKHRVDRREPLNFYLGYTGVLSSLLIAIQALLLTTNNDNDEFVFQNEKLISFINEVTEKLLDYVDEKLLTRMFNDEAHTLLFGQFNASCSVLHDLRWNFFAALSGEKDDGIVAKLLSKSNLEKLNRLLPKRSSFASILYSVVYKNNNTDDKDGLSNQGDFISKAFPNFHDCEPFYGKCGLVATFLKSISSSSSSAAAITSINNNNKDTDEELTMIEQNILQNRLYPLIDSCIQSGVSQANNVRQQLHPEEGTTDANNNNDAANLPPVLWSWQNRFYFGAAHGSAGILYYAFEYLLKAKSLLSNGANNSPQENDRLMRLEHFLLNCLGQTESVAKFPDPTNNNYKPNFDGKSHSKDRGLVQFCHGAAGFIFPLAKAYSLTSSSSRFSSTHHHQQQNSHHPFFKSTYWLGKLTKAADETINRGCLKDSVGLCHSVSGNGFSLLFLLKNIASAHNDNIKNNKTVSSSENDDDDSASVSQNTNYLLQKYWNAVISFAVDSATIAPEIHQNGDHIYSAYEGLCGTISFVGSVLCLLGKDGDENCEKVPCFEEDKNPVLGLTKMPGYEV